jgi:hypothetical protein
MKVLLCVNKINVKIQMNVSFKFKAKKDALIKLNSYTNDASTFVIFQRLHAN